MAKADKARRKPKKESKPAIEMRIANIKSGHTQAPVRSHVGGPVQN